MATEKKDTPTNLTNFEIKVTGNAKADWVITNFIKTGLVLGAALVAGGFMLEAVGYISSGVVGVMEAVDSK